MVRSTTHPYLIYAAAWAVPGAGHLWLGRVQKGLIFLIALPLMFAIGLWLEGRVFPFELTQPLVALAATACFSALPGKGTDVQPVVEAV